MGLLSRFAALVGQCCVLALPHLGCAPLLGIESVTCDPDSAQCVESAEESDSVVADGSCESLCTLSADVCTGANQAYTTDVICLGVCPLFSEEELSCRFDELANAQNLDEPATHCPAVSIAGTRADGARACGSTCATYCRLLSLTCEDAFDASAPNPKSLETFSGEQECVSACEQRGDRSRGFSVTDRDGDTTQCRLWHLAQATIAPFHCEHARGDCPCGPPEICGARLGE